MPNVSLEADTGVFSDFLNDPNQLINSEGRLVNDPTLEWKIYGTYNLPWGFNTGWFFRHHNGDTWAATGQLPREVVGYRPRILLEPLGSQRLPSQNNLDLRVEKGVPLHNGQLLLTADIFNLFNTADVTAVDDHFGDPTFGTPIGYTNPRSIRLGLRCSF
jgi:hypothetical protein